MINGPNFRPFLIVYNIAAGPDGDGGMRWTPSIRTGAQKVDTERSGRRIKRPSPYSGTSRAFDIKVNFYEYYFV